MLYFDIVRMFTSRSLLAYPDENGGVGEKSKFFHIKNFVFFFFIYTFAENPDTQSVIKRCEMCLSATITKTYTHTQGYQRICFHLLI